MTAAANTVNWISSLPNVPSPVAAMLFNRLVGVDLAICVRHRPLVARRTERARNVAVVLTGPWSLTALNLFLKTLTLTFTPREGEV